MVRFRSELYWGKAFEEEKKRQKLIKKLQNQKWVKKDVTLIAYAVNGQDLFDLIPAYELKLPWRKEQELFVLGVGKDKEEALEVVERMVMEVYQATGEFAVREYFGTV